jgi:hypothetical protein
MSAAPRPAARPAEAMLAALALALVTLVVAPPSLRAGDPRPSLLGSGAWGALADNAARVHYDDGYYYLVIAGHVARGDGVTFDGLHATSGYHPLWLLLLVPLAAVASSPAALLIASVALQALLLAASVVVAFRALGLVTTPGAAFLGALLWLPFALVHGVALSGLEWAAHALLLLVAAWLWARDFGAAPVGATARAAARLGIVAALTFLARVDALPLAFCLGVALVRRRAGGRSLAAFTLPVALAVTAYAAFNLHVTGRVTPISAAVKAEWSRALLERDPLFVAHGWAPAKLHQLVWPLGHERRAFWVYLALGTAGIAAALFAEALTRRRVRLPVPLAVWAPFAVFAWLQWLALQALYHDGYAYAPWYFVAQPWLALVLVASGVGLVPWPRVRVVAVRVAAVAVAAFALSGAVAWRARVRAGGEEPLYSVAREVRARVPAGARVGAWNAGQIALLSGRTVVNLDGRVNSWAFREHARGDLCAYWRAQGIAWLADSFPATGVDGLDGAPLPCRERLRLIWSQATGTPERPRLSALYALEP